MNILEKIKSFVVGNKEDEKKVEDENKNIQIIRGENNLSILNTMKKSVGKLHDQMELRVYLSKSEIVRNQRLYNCKIRYKNSHDMEYIDKKMNEEIFENESHNILVGIDLKRLNASKEYREMLLENLLDENRVKNLLENGCKENPQRPCGNYVGRVIEKSEGEYAKAFDIEVGKEVHYGKIGTEMREKMKSQEDIQRQNEIKRLKEDIENNKKKIENLEGNDR